MKKGILYGVGVGPGDPELMTLKAVKILEKCDVVIAPQSDGNDKTAVSIAEQFIKDKPLIYCDMPMTRDKNKMRESHIKATDEICNLLEDGKIVAFLTLGDPSIYSTYWYVHKIIIERGFEAQIISGIPSFCAAAAALNIALVEGSEMLHIIPASHESTEKGLELCGTKVFMKAGRSILNVREKLRKLGKLKGCALVERASMKNEKVIKDLDTINDPTGYFSIIISKEM